MINPVTGDKLMKRIVSGGVSLASLALWLGLAGCGGTSIEEGVPRGDTSKPDVPLDTISTGMMGRMGSKDMARAAAKAKSAAKTGEAPAEKNQ
jgi:hypothetical protein